MYDSKHEPIEIDDRTLAHLRIVLMTKLRRNESFMMLLRTPGGSERWYWIEPSIPIQMQFWGGRPPTINPHWVEVLMRAANSSDGLRLLPEPDAPASSAHET